MSYVAWACSSVCGAVVDSSVVELVAVVPSAGLWFPCMMPTSSLRSMLRMRQVSFRQSLKSAGSVPLNLNFRPFKVLARPLLESPVVAFTLMCRATIARHTCYYRSCPIDLETCRCSVAIPRLAARGKQLVGYRFSLSLLGQCRCLQQSARLSSLLSLLEHSKRL